MQKYVTPWQTDRLVLTLSLILLTSLFAPGSDHVFAQAARQQATPGSGLPVPRFVSLKSDRVNIRGGPGTDHKILWVFRRAGLPVEVIREYQGWRQIRDAEGSIGWVYGAMLSGRRTALVQPWEPVQNTKVRAKLHYKPKPGSKPLAFLQPGVLASIVKCTGRWCEVSISDVRGFIEQKKLWGVYPDERLKQ